MATVYTGNVDFLTAVYDHLFIQQGAATIYTTSSDDGATWSAGTTLKFSIAPFKTAIPAVGTGIVLAPGLCTTPSCGGKAGRLMVPFICTDAAAAGAAVGARFGPGDVNCPGCHSCLLVSDNGGASWALAASSVQDGSREAALVQLNASVVPGAGAGAVVYATERNMGAKNTTGTRWHAVSIDNGATFDAARYAFDAVLPDGERVWICRWATDAHTQR